jgi:pSer/pThr/pTyr-binding forkhead associated (FHA) protein/NADPH-dependent 2,4-dienoyl-CoA reductase/sulfur reductase-like enzyme
VTEYVVIGDGAAGTTAAQYIRRRDPDGRITIYSDDPNAAYYRAALTNYLIGELREDQLFAVPPDFYMKNRIQRVLARVAGVDTANRRIVLASGAAPVAYDRLMIGAGSSPNPPPFPGSELAGVMTMRTMQDARTFMEDLRSGRVKRAIVIGGGPLALEWAAGLRARGADVTYILRGRDFMAGVLDKTGSDLVASRLRAFGCDLRMDEEVAEVLGDRHGHVRAVNLKSSGRTVEAQLVCAAIGIRMNTGFLKDSGIALGKGIPVDEHMRTNVEDVYAAGDIAEVYDPVVGAYRGLGLWEPARLQGRVAGSNMGGGDTVYRAGVLYNATRLYDLDFAGLGRTIEREGDKVVVDLPRGRGTIAYRKLVIEDGRLVGAILLGHRSERVRRHGLRLKRVIEDRLDVSAVADEMLDPGFDLPAWIAQETGQERKATTAFALGGAAPTYSRLFKIADLASPLSRAIPLPAAAEMAAPSLMPEPPSAAVAPVAVLEPPAPGGGGTGPRATLAVQGGATIELGDLTRVGRGPDNDLVLADPLVSGRHAEIRASGEGYVVADVGSRNGTFVRGERITGPVALSDGSEIRFGDTVAVLNLPAPAVLPPPEASPTQIGMPVGAAVSGLFVQPDALVVPVEPRERAVGVLEGAGTRFELVGSEISIGRDPASDIALSDPAVSGTHAQLTEHEGLLYLRDLGSRNGTYVDAVLVTTPHAMGDGEVIHVGETDLTFHAPAGAGRPPAEAAPVPPEAPAPAPPEVPAPAPAPPGPVEPAPAAPSPPPPSPAAPAQPAAPAPAAPGPPTPPPPATAPPSAPPAAPPTAEAPPPPAAPAPSVPTVRLVVEAGPFVGNAFALTPPEVRLGRDPESDVALADPTVSWQHARLTAHAAAWTITDLGSTNGTRVNGERIEPNRATPIDPGAEIRLGDAVLRFEAVG